MKNNSTPVPEKEEWADEIWEAIKLYIQRVFGLKIDDIDLSDIKDHDKFWEDLINIFSHQKSQSFNEGYLKALGDVEREIIGEDREYPKVDKGYWLWCNHCQEWVQEAIWHEYPEFHDKCGRKVERKIRIDFQTWDEETTVYNQRGKDILSKLEELRKGK